MKTYASIVAIMLCALFLTVKASNTFIASSNPIEKGSCCADGKEDKCKEECKKGEGKSCKPSKCCKEKSACTPSDSTKTHCGKTDKKGCCHKK